MSQTNGKPIVKRKPRKRKPLEERYDLAMIQRLYELGLTDQQVGYAVGVSKWTINQWKKKPEFVKTLDGKQIPDNQVVASLFKRATGYTTAEGKELPPDTVACIYWLKNRRPQEWRDKHEVEHSGDLEIREVEVSVHEATS